MLARLPGLVSVPLQAWKGPASMQALTYGAQEIMQRKRYIQFTLYDVSHSMLDRCLFPFTEEFQTHVGVAALRYGMWMVTALD